MKNLWYVLQTKPKKEEDASSYLLAKGLEVLHPLMATHSPRKGRMREFRRPLFPSYIFVNFDLDQDYNLVRWAKGGKKILGFGGLPAPLPEEAVELIRGRMDASGIVRKACSFEPNDVIRIKSGPMKDLLGVVERWVSDSERVRVLLNLVGYQPSIETHYSFLEKMA